VVKGGWTRQGREKLLRGAVVVGQKVSGDVRWYSARYVSRLHAKVQAFLEEGKTRRRSQESVSGRLGWNSRGGVEDLRGGKRVARREVDVVKKRKLSAMAKLMWQRRLRWRGGATSDEATPQPLPSHSFKIGHDLEAHEGAQEEGQRVQGEEGRREGAGGCEGGGRGGEGGGQRTHEIVEAVFLGSRPFLLKSHMGRMPFVKDECEGSVRKTGAERPRAIACAGRCAANVSVSVPMSGDRSNERLGERGRGGRLPVKLLCGQLLETRGLDIYHPPRTSAHGCAICFALRVQESRKRWLLAAGQGVRVGTGSGGREGGGGGGGALMGLGVLKRTRGFGRRLCREGDSQDADTSGSIMRDPQTETGTENGGGGEGGGGGGGGGNANALPSSSSPALKEPTVVHGDQSAGVVLVGVEGSGGCGRGETLFGLCGRVAGVCSTASAALAPVSVAFRGLVPSADWTRSEAANRVVSHLQTLPLPPGAPYWSFKRACKIAAELGCVSDWHGGQWREIQPFLPTRAYHREEQRVSLAASRSCISALGCTHVHNRGRRCPVCLDPQRASRCVSKNELRLSFATNPLHNARGRRSWRSKNPNKDAVGAPAPAPQGRGTHTQANGDAGTQSKRRPAVIKRVVGEEGDEVVWKTVDQVGVEAPQDALGGSGSETTLLRCDASPSARSPKAPATVADNACDRSSCTGICMPSKFARALGLSSWACKCP
jgi:hypothetical protein